MSSSRQMRVAVSRKFKLAGLSVRADAAKALASMLAREDDVQAALGKVVDALKTRVERQELTTSVVDMDAITAVVADLTKDEGDVAQESIQFINAFKMPVLQYNPVRKTFALDHAKRPLHADARHKVEMFRERFALVQQRVLRNKLFSKPLLGNNRDYIELTPLDSLLGSSGAKCLLGMLCQQEEGAYCLEDATSSITLDLSRCRTTDGIFTENCIVMVEGELVDDVFVASMMGFPPPEPRAETMRVMGPTQLDVLGASYSSHHLAEMQELEERSTDSMFVLVSDCHLDQAAVLGKLRVLLQGFEPLQPQLFVFLGNFCSQPLGHGEAGVREMVRHFDALARLLLEFPRLCQHSQFVFVPGPDDPGAANVLPRPALPRFFTDRLRARLPNAYFASNPCRIRFYTQEIVVFREEILHKMRRHAVLPLGGGHGQAGAPGAGAGATRERDSAEHLLKTICDQAHLCPLPLAARPIYWGYDHALRLCPLPDVLILADRTDQYQWKYEDCAVLNPGSFPTDFSFVVYRPATRETEFSRIDE
eukprot:g2524.t1